MAGSGRSSTTRKPARKHWLAAAIASLGQQATLAESPESQRSRHSASAPATLPSPSTASDMAPTVWDVWRTPLTEALVSDRPDFTESAEAIPRGHLQLESGYTFTYDREDGQRRRDHTAPDLLLRAGLFDRFELRLGWPGYSWTSDLYVTETRVGRRVSREEWSQGANDQSVGFKYQVCDQENLRPQLAVIGELAAPSGSRGVSAGDVEPTVKLLWSYDLAERVALAGNVSLSVPQEDGNRFVQVGNSLSLAVSWSDTIGTYCEYFGFYPNSRYSDCAHTLNGGITYLLTDNLQLDWRAGFGLNEEADDFFAGVGFVWRW
ncbi:hypothetical protein RAS1_10110 [Phycisphaerae bacterium RAS1]|nr:hypothetical protein RAS1_10110 [Phycisphaerae bacterium RAS1]